MIDFKNIEKYRENNRIEAKKALGGLPHSIWETYSAFANSFGGVILLGVEEHKDKSLHTVNLPAPEAMIEEFWNIINNSQKVSVNILSDKNVTIHEIDGNRFISIEIPRANRSDKPVYIDGNPMSGSYRRNGEGDYKCTKEEVQAMMRDASVKTQDMLVLPEMGLDVFDYNSVYRYRIRMKNYRPGHVWEELEDEEFLYKLGAIGRSSDGKMHPTAAGLLMFGHEYEIVKEYPNYFLDYQEQFDENNRWTDRIISSSGDWSGNLYDFNADYYGRQGIVIIKRKNSFIFSNPGDFRIDIEVAKSGGISDPRNATLIKIFNMIDVGERAGSGIPNIFTVWNKQGWPAPKIEESYEPERITLSLQIEERGDNAEKVAIKSGDNAEKVAIKSGDNVEKVAIKSELQKVAIIEYLTENVTAKAVEVEELLGVKKSRTRKLLSELIEDGIIIAGGANRNRIYKLKQ
ncbi:MAG: putative DNA binding domain-containing protein [Lachnospiraceae bacterium]|nr:putative DNA binding domain-containing protein [Lachnospiraceae bacterium]